MKRKSISSIVRALAVTMALCGTTFAQDVEIKSSSGRVNTTSRITYHDGPVMIGASDIYVIWYGCWDETCGNLGNPNTQMILTDFLSSIGGSPYFQINAMYGSPFGAPSGALFWAGQVVDHYSHGMELTKEQIAGIVQDQIEDLKLPLDPAGIYLVLASADVSSVSTGFCTSELVHHGTGMAFDESGFRYAFVGNPNRCPSVAAPQFFSGGTLLPTPNADLPADAMASSIAQVLSGVVTNPVGGGWFDRYGLEAAQKCVGQFGPTYLAPNGAIANIRLGQRHWLIQQNWVNGKRGHCAMNSSL